MPSCFRLEQELYIFPHVSTPLLYGFVGKVIAGVFFAMINNLEKMSKFNGKETDIPAEWQIQTDLEVLICLINNLLFQNLHIRIYFFVLDYTFYT